MKLAFGAWLVSPRHKKLENNGICSFWSNGLSPVAKYIVLAIYVFILLLCGFLNIDSK
jgi:hypothetical protein